MLIVNMIRFSPEHFYLIEGQVKFEHFVFSPVSSNLFLRPSLFVLASLMLRLCRQYFCLGFKYFGSDW